ncbi:ATP-binding cassette domain-containing protein [Cryptosporangium sp. NPDC048952]|uniref:ATP-binding cassette domain-containing protein n=1 Tax=Cryptosporangium sp. NPDC048952 TaxID=3363961 RepID=UPI003713F8AE
MGGEGARAAVSPGGLCDAGLPGSLRQPRPALPIWRTITEPLLSAGRAERRAYAEEQLARVGLDAGRLDARPGELSGGQCQRVAVLRALAAEPGLLVADEPASRQDVITGAALGELFAGAGTAVLVVSHDEAWLSRVASRVLTMTADRLQE